MLENGMIVGAGYYDLQCQEPEMETCSVCGESKPAYDMWISNTGYTVCKECERAKDRRLLSDDRFYAEYLPKNVSKSDLAWIMRMGVEAAKKTYDGWQVPLWELDYLLTDAEFLEEVRGS